MKKPDINSNNTYQLCFLTDQYNWQFETQTNKKQDKVNFEYADEQKRYFIIKRTVKNQRNSEKWILNQYKRKNQKTKKRIVVRLIR